jgi:hypothetical protein
LTGSLLFCKSAQLLNSSATPDDDGHGEAGPDVAGAITDYPARALTLRKAADSAW